MKNCPIAPAVLLMLGQFASADDVSRHFESRIRPVLVKTCQKCHGNQQKGGLRLDSREDLLAGGDHGAAVVPGEPQKSLLYQAIARTASRLKMPPGAALEPRVVEDFEKWIAAGAVWPESRREFYQRRVEPVLRKNCYRCHADTSRKGALRLDRHHLAIKGGKSGPAIVPGNPAESLLIALIEHRGKRKMPPLKKLTDQQIADISKWVADGAVYAPPVERMEKYVITDQQRGFWSFQPIAVADLSTSQETHPVDHFISAQLGRRRLEPGHIADPTKLIRRATYDLIGLPPSPDDVVAFVESYGADPAGAWMTLIDQLLDSPQYGERWGRHWLDLVRYADTAGDASDFPIPEAVKYRDYVIAAFNRDLPYDQFIKEQIAGDLLASQNDDQRWQQIIGTGYIAISRRIGVSPHNLRHITIEDTIDNVGRTFLGLTVGCARCHDHKFDPIPTADYYALYGMFASSIYPHPGAEHKPWRQDFVYRIGREKADAVLAGHRKTLAVWDQKERAALDLYRVFQRKKIDDPTKTREKAWQHVLLVREQRRPHAEAFPNLERAYAVVDGPRPQDANIQRGGSPQQQARGPVVRRGFLQILGGGQLAPGASGSGRKELAEWIATAENPLTARVMVNRIWHYHFGTGIVASTSDFGIRGARPTHPGLLDWLAGYFIQRGWSIKAMHRLVMTSNAYRRSTAEIPGNRQVDPNNVYLWRFNRRRLDAEQIRDSVLLFSDRLDRAPGGRHPFDHHLTYFYRQHEPFVGDFETDKRSVYMMQQRINKNPYLDLFDGPDGNIQLAERKATTTTLQALFLMNSEFVHEQSDAIAVRALAVDTDLSGRVEWAYRHIFGRLPHTGETARAEEYFAVAERQYRQVGLAADDALRAAWSGYLRGMISSNEFLFVD